MTSAKSPQLTSEQSRQGQEDNYEDYEQDGRQKHQLLSHGYYW